MEFETIPVCLEDYNVWLFCSLEHTFLWQLMTDIGRISISNALEDTKTEVNPVPRANELHSRSLFYEARSCSSMF